ncbi:hypothetical protein, partial [Carboxylicivirga linearis]
FTHKATVHCLKSLNSLRSNSTDFYGNFTLLYGSPDKADLGLTFTREFSPTQFHIEIIFLYQIQLFSSIPSDNQP